MISTATFTRANGSIGTLGNVSLGYIPGRTPVPSTGSGSVSITPPGSEGSGDGLGNTPPGAPWTDVPTNPGVDDGALGASTPARRGERLELLREDQVFGAGAASSLSSSSLQLSPAIEAAIAALRGGAASRLDPFNLPDDPGLFDAIESAQRGEKVELVPFLEPADNAPQAHTQEMPLAVEPLVDDSAPLSAMTVNVTLDSAAHQLALLRQDMAGFGGIGFNLSPALIRPHEYAPQMLSMY